MRHVHSMSNNDGHYPEKSPIAHRARAIDPDSRGSASGSEVGPSHRFAIWHEEEQVPLDLAACPAERAAAKTLAPRMDCSQEDCEELLVSASRVECAAAALGLTLDSEPVLGPAPLIWVAQQTKPSFEDWTVSGMPASTRTVHAINVDARSGRGLAHAVTTLDVLAPLPDCPGDWPGTANGSGPSGAVVVSPQGSSLAIAFSGRAVVLRRDEVGEQPVELRAGSDAVGTVVSIPCGYAGVVYGSPSHPGGTWIATSRGATKQATPASQPKEPDNRSCGCRTGREAQHLPLSAFWAGLFVAALFTRRASG